MLQQELDATRAYLQSLVEEHEATNEELKSAHEEVLSSNEELQSMNEELQTAKEEMQSANEELVTLNDELNHRNKELGKVKDDVVNLLGGVDIPIIMVGRDLTIRRFTPQAQRLLNIIPSDVGRPVTDIRHHLAIPDFEELLRQVIGQLVPVEREVQDLEGHWWTLRIRPYVTQDSRIDGATIVAFDVDAMKRKSDREVEQSRLLISERTARADAEMASRMKDEFLAMLAHELRNLLAPIMTSIDILRHHLPEAPIIDRTLDIAERQIMHMSRLLDDLLDVSRITQGKILLRKKKISAHAAIERAIDSVRSALESHKLHIETSYPVEPVFLDADPTRLEQILINLLGNAIKYTPPDGKITVTVSQEADEAVVRIRDDGLGIAPDVLPRIFELFVQGSQPLDRARGGLGIGLTLVRRLTELHGGSVQAFNAGPGQGSEFTLRLPLDSRRRRRADAAPAGDRQACSPAAVAGRRRHPRRGADAGDIAHRSGARSSGG